MSEQRALFFVRKGEDDTNEFHLSLCDRRDGVQRPAYTFPQGMESQMFRFDPPARAGGIAGKPSVADFRSSSS
jgi:hypothetical protein